MKTTIFGFLMFNCVVVSAQYTNRIVGYSDKYWGLEVDTIGNIYSFERPYNLQGTGLKVYCIDSSIVDIISTENYKYKILYQNDKYYFEPFLKSSNYKNLIVEYSKFVQAHRKYNPNKLEYTYQKYDIYTFYCLLNGYKYGTRISYYFYKDLNKYYLASFCFLNDSIVKNEKIEVISYFGNDTFQLTTKGQDRLLEIVGESLLIYDGKYSESFNDDMAKEFMGYVMANFGKIETKQDKRRFEQRIRKLNRYAKKVYRYYYPKLKAH